MNHFKVTYILAILLTVSCCKEDTPAFITDSEGAIISKTYYWKTSLLGSNSNNFGYIYFPAIHNGNIVVFSNEDNGCLRMIEVSTGKFKWTWSDIFPNTPGNDYQILHHYSYGNLMTWGIGKRSYCINLENGSTQWRVIRDYTFHPTIWGKQNIYFTTGYSNNFLDIEIKIGYKGNLVTGEIEEFLIPDFSFEHSIAGRCCDVTEMIPFEVDGVPHLAVVYQELRSSEVWNFQSFLGLYNLNTEEWVYDRKIMNEPNLYGVSLAPPVIYNGKFYANIGKELVCHDLTTGERVWKRAFEQDFMFSGFIIEDGMLLANCEDTYTYRLDPLTGATIWRTKGAGTCSRMSYLNGVVYFVGGSTGFLHALDAETGRVLWRIDARRLGEPNGNFTTNAVYCIPGEGGARGRVVALTGRYAYCFEAAR